MMGDDDRSARDDDDDDDEKNENVTSTKEDALPMMDGTCQIQDDYLVSTQLDDLSPPIFLQSSILCLGNQGGHLDDDDDDVITHAQSHHLQPDSSEERTAINDVGHHLSTIIHNDDDDDNVHGTTTNASMPISGPGISADKIITPVLPIQEHKNGGASLCILSPPEEQEESLMHSIKLTSSIASGTFQESTTNDSDILEAHDSSLLLLPISISTSTTRMTNTTPQESDQDTGASWCEDVLLSDPSMVNVPVNEEPMTNEITKNIIDSSRDKKMITDNMSNNDDIEEGDFTVIELVTPLNNTINHPLIHNQQEQGGGGDGQQQDPILPDSDGDYDLISSNNDLENDMASRLPLLLPTTHNTSTSSFPSQQQQHHHRPPPKPSNPSPLIRRKILHHPMLTPLTKLPWDKFISAAGACDVLFNCKYSMRQVEDEVREEERNVLFRIGDGGDSNASVVSGGYYIGYNGNNGGEEGALIENEMKSEPCCNNNDREDGYVNVNDLGNDCSDYDYGIKEDCDVEEFTKLGLDCCSMMDNDVEDEEQPQKSDVELETPAAADQESKNYIAQNLSNSEEIGEERWEYVPDKRSENRGFISDTSHPTSACSVISNDQKADSSWRNSNPSLDMLLYRTMLNE